MFNKINWKVRFMNKAWVASFIAALFVVIYAVGDLFGLHLDLTNLQDNIVKLVYAIFGVLTVVGVSLDGTTPGIVDSEKALTYTVPGINEDEFDDEIFDDTEDYDEDEIDDFDEDEMAKADEIEGE